MFIKPISTKAGKQLSWIYRHEKKDVTKNFSFAESLEKLKVVIGSEFYQADMFCIDKEYFLKTKNKTTLSVKSTKIERTTNSNHNREKNRLVSESTSFLKLLGVTSEDGFLKKDKRDKFIQINKFLEFFSAASQDLKGESVSVVDMGSGKGYLTFAIYDFLVNKMQKEANVIGVEYRDDMVELCNALSEKAGFDGLRFEQGTIQDFGLEKVDVLIALHACDTATDDAIFKAIKSDAKIIMLSPCCHKQVRKAMKASPGSEIFHKHGIILERTAEMLTDLIRASILEYHGYKTQIFEFVNSGHTPKNLMITAVKKRKISENKAAMEVVEKLKADYGVGYHYLQGLLEG